MKVIKEISAREKYASLKTLLQTAKENPSVLYPEFDKWLGMIDDENNFIKWAGIDIIGNLSRVDKKNKIDEEVLQVLFKILKGGKMISANHAVYALGIIAANKPEFTAEIIDNLLKVSKYRYETGECLNIVTGKVILALGDLKERIVDNKSALRFISDTCKNTRNATKTKAEKLLKQLAKK